jgi:hypothetical protein
VNVANQLLLDILTGHVDAALVVSNDSDLEVPLREARRRVPVGTINPTRRPAAAALKAPPARELAGTGDGGGWEPPTIVDTSSRPCSAMLHDQPAGESG